MQSSADTIAAVATPRGRGGIGIVRISGDDALAIAKKITGQQFQPRLATFSRYRRHDGELLDEGLTLFFPKPNSFTGEDVVELQCHGSPITLDRLLNCITEHGARLARPGEFSERAFLNDKIDLTQAEAIADLIDAETEQAAACALRSLSGEFSAYIAELKRQIIELRVHVEAAIDFPEEEIDFLADAAIANRVQTIESQLQAIWQRAKVGVLLTEGLQIAIIGRPNAGKSTLLNRLSGRESAIVTDIPGTTRDVMREHIQLNGIPCHVVDTAGLRPTEDLIERIGIERAFAEIHNADHVILLVDARELDDIDALLSELSAECQSLPQLTIVANKIDLITQPIPNQISGHPLIALSAKNGEGFDALVSTLLSAAECQQQEGQFTARRRHLDALAEVDNHIQTARQHLQHRAGELVAEECRLAQLALNLITGEFSSDDLLGEIFSNFCIGK